MYRYMSTVVQVKGESGELPERTTDDTIPVLPDSISSSSETAVSDGQNDFMVRLRKLYPLAKKPGGVGFGDH